MSHLNTPVCHYSMTGADVCFVGDEILGATINFEQLSKEEVLRVLKVMEPFNDKVHVFTRNNRSKSLGNLEQCASPEAVGGAHRRHRCFC